MTNAVSEDVERSFYGSRLLTRLKVGSIICFPNLFDDRVPLQEVV